MRPSNSPNSNITREDDDDTSSSIDTLPSCHHPQPPSPAQAKLNYIALQLAESIFQLIN